MNLTAAFYLISYFYCVGKGAFRPMYALYAYFLSFYFHAPTQWWGASLPDLRWTLLASVVWLLSLLYSPPTGGFRFWKYTENKLLFLLACYVSIQYLFVSYSEAHIEYVVLLWKFILFIFLFQNTVSSTRDLLNVVYINVFGAVFLAYLGITTHSGGRLEGLGTPGLESANQLGQHFLVILLMSSFILLGKNSWRNVILAMGLCIILSAIFMTESRGVIISMVAAGLISLFFVPHGSYKKFFLFVILAVFSCSVLMGPQIMERFDGMKSDELGEIEDPSARSRIVIIDAQIAMFKMSPWVGHGHNATYFLSPSYIPEEYLSAKEGARASHNRLMSFLVDHGMIGALLYFSAAAVCFVSIFRVKRPPPTKNTEEYRILSRLLVGLCLALSAFLLAGMGSNNKKLEADIWVLAMVPIVTLRMKELESLMHEAN